MRRYQKKQVEKLSTLYKSKDVLRWWYMAQLLGVDYQPSKREVRIFFRRIGSSVKHVVKVARDVFAGLSQTVAQISAGMKQMAEAMQEKQS